MHSHIRQVMVLISFNEHVPASYLKVFSKNKLVHKVKKHVQGRSQYPNHVPTLFVLGLAYALFSLLRC